MWWVWCIIVLCAALVAFAWGCDIGRESERRSLADEWRDLQRLRLDILRREAEGRVGQAVERLIEESRWPDWEQYR